MSHDSPQAAHLTAYGSSAEWPAGGWNSSGCLQCTQSAEIHEPFLRDCTMGTDMVAILRCCDEWRSGGAKKEAREEEERERREARVGPKSTRLHRYSRLCPMLSFWAILCSLCRLSPSRCQADTFTRKRSAFPPRAQFANFSVLPLTSDPSV